MTVALEIGIGDLLTELAADTFIVLGSFNTAGAVAAFRTESILHGSDNFLVFIQSDLGLHGRLLSERKYFTIIIYHTFYKIAIAFYKYLLFIKQKAT